MIRCNNCWKHFESDSDLTWFDNPNNAEENFQGCPNCETDSYLMDLDKTMTKPGRRYIGTWDDFINRISELTEELNKLTPPDLVYKDEYEEMLYAISMFELAHYG